LDNTLSSAPVVYRDYVHPGTYYVFLNYKETEMGITTTMSKAKKAVLCVCKRKIGTKRQIIYSHLSNNYHFIQSFICLFVFKYFIFLIIFATILVYVLNTIS